MPDSTLYRTPSDAVAAPPEKLAYIAAFDRSAQRSDALIVLDVDPDSASYGKVRSTVELPGRGDELHHFGWNACSSALKHEGHHDAERRYLLVPGLRSSRLHVFDTQPDPASSQPRHSPAGITPAAAHVRQAISGRPSRRGRTCQP